MKTEPFDQAAFDHIIGSSADPAFLANLYGITIYLVHQIQMGKVKTFEDARELFEGHPVHYTVKAEIRAYSRGDAARMLREMADRISTDLTFRSESAPAATWSVKLSSDAHRREGNG